MPKFTLETLENLSRLGRVLAHAEYVLDRLLTAAASPAGLPLGASVTAAPFVVELPADMSRVLLDHAGRLASSMLEEARSILREHGVEPPRPFPTDFEADSTVDLSLLSGLIHALRPKPDAKWSDAEVAAMRERGAAPMTINRIVDRPADLNEPEHEAPGLAPPLVGSN